MPVVDGKEFPYTDKGKKDAGKFAKKTGGKQIKTYHGGGILNRSSGPPYKESIKHSRGGGAARKDSTRFVVVTS